MVISIQVRGINRASRFLSKKSRQIDNGIQSGINKASMHVQNEVKESIAGRKPEPRSVDTGAFLRSINIQTSKDKGIIFTPLEYPKFLEFGTSNRPARKHFFNTASRNKQKVVNIIKTEINKI